MPQEMPQKQFSLELTEGPLLVEKLLSGFNDRPDAGSYKGIYAIYGLEFDFAKLIRTMVAGSGKGKATATLASLIPALTGKDEQALKNLWECFKHGKQNLVGAHEKEQGLFRRLSFGMENGGRETLFRLGEILAETYTKLWFMYYCGKGSFVYISGIKRQEGDPPAACVEGAIWSS